MREVSTSEALMTDPTTPEGAAYWQQRHDYELALERLEGATGGGEAIEQPGV
jgi:hypothetical protein